MPLEIYRFRGKRRGRKRKTYILSQFLKPRRGKFRLTPVLTREKKEESLALNLF